MSNLSSIGFPLQAEEEFGKLVDFCFNNGQDIKCPGGGYYVYADSSGAELYGQYNDKKEIIGMNPHFKGKSKRKVCLTESYTEPESEFDGAFHCWADPEKENDPETGAYPFMFDVPDFKTIGKINYPKTFDIQLAAFAQEIKLYDDEEAFDKQAAIGEGEGEQELKFASQSFIPSGLFSEDENDSPDATAFFAGTITEWRSFKNEQTHESFTWMLVETLGGEVDVIFDPALTGNEPKIGGVVQGSFWLSGKLLDPPFQEDVVETKKSFWKKLFG